MLESFTCFFMVPRWPRLLAVSPSPPVARCMTAALTACSHSTGSQTLVSMLGGAGRMRNWCHLGWCLAASNASMGPTVTTALSSTTWTSFTESIP